LKKFGLSLHDKDISIQKSISEVFDNINISCESTSVYFKRKWLPLEIIQNENIGLYNKKMQKWLNGL
jgi:hypothetical protein